MPLPAKHPREPGPRSAGPWPKEAWQARHEAEARVGLDVASRALQAAAAGNREAWRNELQAAAALPGAAKPDKRSARIHVDLYHCLGCAAGYLSQVLTTGFGRSLQRQELLRAALPPEMTKVLSTST